MAQFGGGEQPVDDIGRALDAVIDERRLAVGAGDEQGRGLTLAKRRRKLNIDLVAVVENLGGPPRRIAVDAVAEANGVEGNAGIDDGVARLGSGFSLALADHKLGQGIGPGETGYIGFLRRGQLQMVGAPIGGDDEIGGKICRCRLDVRMFTKVASVFMNAATAEQS